MGPDGRTAEAVCRGEGEGLKGCAARTGKPASALDPLALTPAFGRHAVSRDVCPPSRGCHFYFARGVTFLSCADIMRH
jgi:hypothetical protein